MGSNFGRSLGQGGPGHAPWAGHLASLPGVCGSCTPDRAAMDVAAGVWRLRTLAPRACNDRVAIFDVYGTLPVPSARAACAAAGLPLTAALLLRGGGPICAERLLCAAVAQQVATAFLVLDAAELTLCRRAAGPGAPDVVRLVRRGGVLLLGMCCSRHLGAAHHADDGFTAWAVPLQQKPFFCGSLGSSVAP